MRNMRKMLGGCLALGAGLLALGSLATPAQAQRILEITSTDPERFEVVEQGDRTWVFDRSLRDPAAQGMRVEVLTEGAPPLPPIGTGNEGADQARKQGVIRSCTLFYRDPGLTCSRLPDSKVRASRLGPTKLRPGELVVTNLPESRIPRGPQHIGVVDRFPSRLPRTTLPGSRQRPWPDPRAMSYGPPDY